MVEISLKSQITTNITRNIDIKTPKLTVYIKTNEINPCLLYTSDAADEL